MTQDRYICIHGHFYQPPRENPWLGSVEIQDSAAPYHDWNERVLAECYAPNARARILNGQGRIHHILNNYSRISFNFGPTLLSWLDDNAPSVYAAVLAADRESAQRFGGHGSAMAQAYGHAILPLADERDLRTQVAWGVRDFEHRFRRKPEGMWLPETAVNTATLEALAAVGIKFTVLAPHQAKRVRSKTDGWWLDVSDGSIDTRRAYEVRLPSGRRIAVFFYHGPTARAVAFEDALRRGEEFAARLRAIHSTAAPEPQLASIATDGETYGHHHRFAEMALAYALELFEKASDVRLTNYAEFLDRHPPQWEVEILENTSWSCEHGVERWRDDCGCKAGGEPGWRQHWRKPLRDALDWLQAQLAAVFEREAGRLLRDPWAARDDYIEVVLNRSPVTIARFLARQAGRKLNGRETVQALKLLELQRNALLMYTSCGWFFNDLAGIETLQVLQYAGRAIHLAEEVAGRGDIEEGFTRLLARARSNRPTFGDGARIYADHVRPCRVDLATLVAHYGASSLFEPYGKKTNVHCYTVSREDMLLSQAGKARLAIGRVKVASAVTLESARMSFAVLHLGDQNLSGGVRPVDGARDHRQMAQALKRSFDSGDLPEVLRRIDEEFPGRAFSLRSLFRDEQRRVLEMVLGPALDEAALAYREVYEENLSMIRFLHLVGYPMPRRLRVAAEISIGLGLRREFEAERPDVERVRGLLIEAEMAGVEVDEARLAPVVASAVARLASRLGADPWERGRLERFAELVGLLSDLPFGVDIWQAQNVYYDLARTVLPEAALRARSGDAEARAWLDAFVPLADLLHITLPEP